MAQAKRKKTSKKTTAGSSSQAGRKQAVTKTPRRREITALVLFLLAVFSFIGYFDADGAFIGFFSGLAKGLIGPGFFAMPPALLIAAAILCFHRGRPIRLRAVCAIFLAVLFGSLWHLFFCKLEYDISFGMLKLLWYDGKMLLSGGAVSGAFSLIFTYLFSKAGTAVVFICLMVLCAISVANVTVAGAVDAWRRREKREYIPEPEPEPRPERIRNTESQASPPPKIQKPKRKTAIDIPLDSEEPPAASAAAAQAPAQESLYKPETGEKTPEQQAAEYIQEDSAVDTASDYNESDVGTYDNDVELDIPFMDRKTGKQAQNNFSQDTVEIPQKESKNASAEQRPHFEFPETMKTDENPSVYSYPPVELLTTGEAGTRIDGSEEVRMNSERLEAAFRSFGVSVRISNTTRGPSVTRHEAELEAGIKLNKLTGLADDIALSLGASGVRIAAMPDKISTVGIEVPNKLISKVYLRDIIESPEFLRAASKLTFAIGKDISGEAVVGNISKLPHMLVAGTTGSGKSVCLNSIILSILYKATPDDVRFIMIDPKMVEFRVYNSIPHLLVPVVTDVKKAAGALQWAVVEMMKRYKLFSEVNARDLEGYNTIARKSDEDDIRVIPQIVVIIDELADLMMTAAKEVEESICRVAQMGRAAGVHLIIATQSPRADVITGLMKANIPSRIALKVSSALESRIILDAGGNADKLVGNGDMLYAPIGTTKPLRIQGTWVSDEERESVVEFIKKSGEAQYSQDVMSEIDKAAEDKTSGSKEKDEPALENESDELLPQAVEVIFETGQASVSMLQRRLKLGYSRAARIVDQMEQMGIVGPFEGSKPRALLITKEQWRQMQYINGTAPIDN